MSVGWPAWLHLNLFGSVVCDGLGHYPYLVGSATESKDWRDVDVVVILSDDEFEERYPGCRPGGGGAHPKYAAEMMAWCALAAQMTGLPIDFKAQPQTWANEHFKGPRHALILPVREPGPAAEAYFAEALTPGPGCCFLCGAVRPCSMHTPAAPPGPTEGEQT